MLELRAFGAFWWSSTLRALKTPLALLGGLSALVALLLRAYASFRPIQDTTMDVLTWAIPLSVFVATVVIGFAIGPYLIYRESNRERSSLREQLQGRQTGLVVADDLEEDDSSAWSLQFRLRVRSTRGSKNVEAHIERVTDAAGVDIHGIPSLPLQLHWSHHNNQRVMRVSPARAAGETFGVCAVRPENDGAKKLVLTCVGGFEVPVSRFFEDNRVIQLVICISADLQREERRFAFQPDGGSPMLCRAWAVEPSLAISPPAASPSSLPWLNELAIDVQIAVPAPAVPHPDPELEKWFRERADRWHEDTQLL